MSTAVKPKPGDAGAEKLRKLLFVPCETKEHLHLWIRTYLHLDMPDEIVDPDSTSSPMDLIWEVYDKARRNVADFDQILAYAARDSFKTLGAAVLEVLVVLHLQRNVAHMAAIKAQSQKSQSYVKGFFSKPYLRDYVVKANESMREISRYYNEVTGENLTTAEFEKTPENMKGKYTLINNYIIIVVCTMAGANSEHVPFFVIDEVDVVADKKAYAEAKGIPAPWGGYLPITLYTSTRKFNYGLVQKEIDNANVSGLHIRHWNIIDVTARCPNDRHRPDLPKIDVMISKDELNTVTPQEHALFVPERQAKYEKDTAYSGCLSNCRIFAACRGRLATRTAVPEKRARQSLLKPVAHTQNMFKKVDLEFAKAQLLAWKPSTAGLIYPNFAADTHVLAGHKILQKITGEEHAPLRKHELIARLKEIDGVRFVAGMDFGYTHNFSVVLAAVWGNYCFVLEVVSQAQIEVQQQIQLCNKAIMPYRPQIYADPENPEAIIQFKKKGYRIKPVVKGPGSVIGGITVVRSLIRPGVGEPRFYLLADDLGCDLLRRRLGEYHWKLDAQGEPSDIPDDENDDECDAMRYMAMSAFSGSAGLATAESAAGVVVAPDREDNWVQQQIDKAIGLGTQDEVTMGGGDGVFWEIG